MRGLCNNFTKPPNNWGISFYNGTCSMLLVRLCFALDVAATQVLTLPSLFEQATLSSAHDPIPEVDNEGTIQYRSTRDSGDLAAIAALLQLAHPTDSAAAGRVRGFFPSHALVVTYFQIAHRIQHIMLGATIAPPLSIGVGELDFGNNYQVILVTGFDIKGESVQLVLMLYPGGIDPATGATGSKERDQSDMSTAFRINTQRIAARKSRTAELSRFATRSAVPAARDTSVSCQHCIVQPYPWHQPAFVLDRPCLSKLHTSYSGL